MRLLRVFFLLVAFECFPLEQCTLFQEKGYVWIKDFFSEEQVALLRNWADAIHDTSVLILDLSQSSGHSLQTLAKELPWTLVIVPEAKNPAIACRAEDLSSSFPGLYAFVMGTVGAYIGQMMGEPYVLYKDKLNFKWPGGGAFPPHQDYPAYELLGAHEHVTAMISIDPATKENGCLHIAEEWKHLHNAVILPYIVGGSGHGSICPEFSEKIAWRALETSPRDLVLFNSFVPHYSDPNQSDRPRRAMFFTFNRLAEGDFRQAYYYAKRQDPDNPIFHFGTPTKARTK